MVLKTYHSHFQGTLLCIEHSLGEVEQKKGSNSVCSWWLGWTAGKMVENNLMRAGGAQQIERSICTEASFFFVAAR